ncbi:MAG: prephenate dehydrogenase/arogenate dehydrogenase family protein, partial [Candidatus Nitrosopelagicus sp.]|nr:prephenate dehydrogenase/arogenate dehydrogenase family protein [Candidatus Nitrosopelagicus sp.]
GYFVKKGFEVTGFDTENPIPTNIKKAESLISAILNMEYVLLSTPTKKTPEIIRLIAKEMRRESFLIDITSQKSKTATALGKIPAKVCPVCIHPMFGPGAKGVKNQNIISIPIKDGKKELDVAKNLFPDANFVTIDSNEHDKKIAIILGLTHLINIAFANILAKDDKILLTEKMAGTTFKAQKIIAESILTESPELIETIISNPEIRRVAEEFWKDIGRLLSSAQEGNGHEIVTYINSNKEKLSQNIDLEKSYKKLTKMVSTMKN